MIRQGNLKRQPGVRSNKVKTFLKNKGRSFHNFWIILSRFSKHRSFLFKQRILYFWDVGVKGWVYTRRGYNCLEFSLAIPSNVFILIRWWFGSNRLSAISVSFIIFFQEGGSEHISCYHLKLEKLLKPNSSLILLKDFTFPLLSNNW